VPLRKITTPNPGTKLIRRLKMVFIGVRVINGIKNVL
jgi:hypothetical protein